MTQYVFFFGGGKADGNKDMKDTLGGKGSGLAEMTNAGVPVPPGFTISTRACNLYFEGGALAPGGARRPGRTVGLGRLEKLQGKKFGDDADPLLVSVRSGAKFSMPGMMDTILNLGLNDRAVDGLARVAGDRRFAFDSYRRFIQMYSVRWSSTFPSTTSSTSSPRRRRSTRRRPTSSSTRRPSTRSSSATRRWC